MAPAPRISSAYDEDPSLPTSSATPLGLQLCDADGMVRAGAIHHGTDYLCPGLARFAGRDIQCISPAHREAGNRCCDQQSVGDLSEFLDALMRNNRSVCG